MQAFVEGYLDRYENKPLAILEIGSRGALESQDTYRNLFPNPLWIYTGLDIQDGENVDLVIHDQADWNKIESCCYDVVICGQVFEHDPLFWVTALEIVRVMKHGGLACLIAPGAGPLHRYPLDCWRFYADGLPALCRYMGLKEIESFTQLEPLYFKDDSDRWWDTCIVMQKNLDSDVVRSVISPVDNKAVFQRLETKLKARNTIHDVFVKSRYLIRELKNIARFMFASKK